MLPAYVPNPVAAAAGGGRPIDGGRNFFDGKRILGDGKTWRGLLIGILVGILVGAVQITLQNQFNLISVPWHTPLSVVLFATGALLGDIGKSFFKRRLGKDRGARWPVADQYDLVIGAFILAVIFDYPWLVHVMSVPIIIALVILTPLLHRGANLIGYAIGVKKEPW
ncbi:MAG: CDP-2,3-bis-(O-geranylgeranyl)-sn-glycerol synthase [Methanoregulaceae archaeon]